MAFELPRLTQSSRQSYRKPVSALRLLICAFYGFHFMLLSSCLFAESFQGRPGDEGFERFPQYIEQEGEVSKVRDCEGKVVSGLAGACTPRKAAVRSRDSRHLRQKKRRSDTEAKAKRAKDDNHAKTH